VLGHDNQKAKNYVRKVDLETPITSVCYEHRGGDLKSNPFCTKGGNGLAMQPESSRKTQFTIRLAGIHGCEYETNEFPNSLELVSDGSIVLRLVGVEAMDFAALRE
jgi:hypothetical protein